MSGNFCYFPLFLIMSVLKEKKGSSPMTHQIDEFYKDAYTKRGQRRIVSNGGIGYRGAEWFSI